MSVGKYWLRYEFPAVHGKCVPLDYVQAVRWYWKAEQGNARAQYHLGLMYGRGRGVLQDYVRCPAVVLLGGRRDRFVSFC